MSVLALIPARGGSKGLPGKNIRPLCGRPLLAWTVDAALESGVVDRIVLSTDDPEIAAVGRAAGALVPALRPPEIACDTTPMRDVIGHAVAGETMAGHRPEAIVLLQPTSPLRTASHIREACRILRTENCDSVVSVVPVPQHLCPDYVMSISAGCLRPFLPEGASIRRRQDVRPAWYRDGTIYAFWRTTFEATADIYGRRCVPLVVEPSLSGTIDTLEDFEEVEARLVKLRRESAGSEAIATV